MLENIRNTISRQDQINQAREEITSKQPSFKGRSNPVDNTPATDTYQGQPVPKESSPLRSAAFVLPTWYGLNKSADLFNKSCGGKYEKSLMGRLGRFGDYLAGATLFNNRITRKISSGWSSFKTKAQAFIDKHPMLSAMQKTPTEPENQMPKSFMESQTECDIKEATAELEDFIQKTPKSLKESGATKAEIDALKQKYGTNIFGKIKNERAAIQEFQLRKLGGDNLAQRIISKESRVPDIIRRYEARIAAMSPTDPARTKALERLGRLNEMAGDYRGFKLKDLKIKTLGLGGGVLETIKSNPLAHGATVEAALDKAATAAPKLSRHANKLKALRIPTTKLGKLLPKLSKLGMRGMTFGGGILNTAFIAFPLATSIKNAVDAPKDKKTGTLAQGVMDAMSWVISMPLALLGMHGINGLKNTGLSKSQYKLFKDELKAFNLKTKSGGFATLAEWSAEKARISALKTVSGPQSKFTKFMKGIGEFLSVGLEQFKPFKESTEGLTGAAKRAAKSGNIKRAMPNFLKNCLGYPLRFALYMFAFAPVVDKVLSWGTKALFGEAYEPDKIREEMEKAAQERAQLYPGPKIVPNQEAVKGLENVDINSLSNNNLIKQKVLGVKPDAPQPQPQNQGFNAAPVTMVKGEPFMPPTFPQQNNTPANPQQAQNSGSNDTIPRSYVPSVNLNAPLPYNDPMNDPNNPKNYKAAEEILNRSDKLMKDLDKYISNGYKN